MGLINSFKSQIGRDTGKVVSNIIAESVRKRRKRKRDEKENIAQE